MMPTQEEMDEARTRAAKLGLAVRGRKHFVLDDGKERQPCGGFDGLMFMIEWRETIERGEPTYILLPCGSAGTAFMNDKEETKIHVERDDDGDLTIEGAKYKRVSGSKVDAETGETIQFDILDDGSHKETRRFPKEDDDDEDDEEEAAEAIPAQVLTLTRRVKALIEKGDRAADKAEQFYKAAGIHIKEIKDKRPEDWESIIREVCDVGRSRAYELMAIADGKTTLEKVRDRSNRSSKISHAKKSAVQRTKPEPAPETDEERDRKTCVELYQKVLDAERKRAQWLADHPGKALGDGPMHDVVEPNDDAVDWDAIDEATTTIDRTRIAMHEAAMAVGRAAHEWEEATGKKKALQSTAEVERALEELITAASNALAAIRENQTKG
jgi:hypothetical protein